MPAILPAATVNFESCTSLKKSYGTVVPELIDDNVSKRNKPISCSTDPINFYKPLIRLENHSYNPIEETDYIILLLHNMPPVPLIIQGQKTLSLFCFLKLYLHALPSGVIKLKN